MTKDEIWKTRKDAHLVHHRIADFILNKDDRAHPPALASLVAKYHKIMREAAEAEKS